MNLICYVQNNNHMAETISKKATLPFTIQTQMEEVWCWAAVGASCALFYNPNSGWTQCKVVNQTAPAKSGDCCSGTDRPSDCVVTGFLDNINHIGSLDTTHIANGFEHGAIPFKKLMEEIDAGRIVPYRVNINGLFHFVAISSYQKSTASEIVTVNDPFFGNSDMEYSVFSSDYKHGGFVTHTFFTQPPQTV